MRGKGRGSFIPEAVLFDKESKSGRGEKSLTLRHQKRRPFRPQ